MDPIFYVMAIMGCGDGSTGCTEARVVQARYETVQECQANLPAMLAQHTDVPYPVISATCRRNAPQYAKAELRRPRG